MTKLGQGCVENCSPCICPLFLLASIAITTTPSPPFLFQLISHRLSYFLFFLSSSPCIYFSPSLQLRIGENNIHSLFSEAQMKALALLKGAKQDLGQDSGDLEDEHAAKQRRHSKYRLCVTLERIFGKNQECAFLLHRLWPFFPCLAHPLSFSPSSLLPFFHVTHLPCFLFYFLFNPCLCTSFGVFHLSFC